MVVVAKLEKNAHVAAFRILSMNISSVFTKKYSKNTAKPKNGKYTRLCVQNPSKTIREKKPKKPYLHFIFWLSTTYIFITLPHIGIVCGHIFSVMQTKISKTHFSYFSFHHFCYKNRRTLLFYNSVLLNKSIFYSYLKKSVETSWLPLTPEHGFPSLLCL